MQSLNIKRPTERSNQAKASGISIDCPAATAAATAIPSGYFVPAVSTDCSVSTVLDLLDLLCRPTVPTDCSTATATATTTAVPTSYSTAAVRPFRSAVSIVLPLLF
jgi:hypothetical protein